MKQVTELELRLDLQPQNVQKIMKRPSESGLAKWEIVESVRGTW